MNQQSFRTSLISVAMASALAACGGGGGDSTATQPPVAVTPVTPVVPVPVAPVAPVTPAAPINTAPQSATYAATSPEAAVFQQLNEERNSCGFGFLKQSAVLDQVTQDANAYFRNRAAESFASARSYLHLQDGAKSGFTGIAPSDRARFRSYLAPDNGGVKEENSSLYSPVASSLSNKALAIEDLGQLLTSVYHLGGIMSSLTELGLDYTRVTTADGVDAGRLNMTLAVPTGGVRQVDTKVRTYPCAGTTRVLPTFVPSNESPNPAPDLGTTTIGTPVYINGPEGQTLTVATASISPTAGGAALASRVLTYNEEPIFKSLGVHALKLNDAYILPLVPLTKGVSYTVTITGDSNGVAFTKTFAFTPSL